MGNYYSSATPSSPPVRLLTYNVEWGFMTLPSDVKEDAGKHEIPHTQEAQETHLRLVAKNIGLLNPDICFLQEMGSLTAMKFITTNIQQMYNMKYDVYYSNGDETGYQGVGLLLKEGDKYTVENVPNFYLNRALGVTRKGVPNAPVVVGVHLKPLYDHDNKKDTQEQLGQIRAVTDWINGRPAVICGDMNNVPNSTPITNLTGSGYVDLIASDRFVPSITQEDTTEVSVSEEGEVRKIRLDYIMVSRAIEKTALSCHIVNLERTVNTKNADPRLRQENSDHLPVLAVFQM